MENDKPKTLQASNGKPVKVKILESIAGMYFSYSPGEMVEVDEIFAKDWIAHGLAEKVK